MSTLAGDPGIRRSDPEPASTTAARDELRLSVETEAWEEKRFVTSRVRSESLNLRRANCLSLASTTGVNSRPTILASAWSEPIVPLASGAAGAALPAGFALPAGVAASFGLALPSGFALPPGFAFVSDAGRAGAPVTPW